MLFRFSPWHSLPVLLGVFAASWCQAQVREADWETTKTNITISASEQFRVFGGDPRSRGTLASFAEREKDRFLQLLGQNADEWHHLIILRLTGSLADPAVKDSVDWAVNQFGKTFSLEIRITLNRSFQRETLRDTLWHMLLFEMALRDVEVAVTDDLIPRWLREGLPGAQRWRQRGGPSGFFKTIFRLNLVTPASEILTATKADVDAVSRAVYETSASAFVLMLLDQQNGPGATAKLIHALGGAHGATGHNLIARYFPALLGSAERLERRWVLHCSKWASPQALDFLDAAATEAQLAAALKIRFLEFDDAQQTADSDIKKKRGFLGALWNRKGSRTATAQDKRETPAEEIQASTSSTKRPTREFAGTIDDFERILPRKDRHEILAPVRQELLQLGFRSFPLYRPLVNDYLELIGDLMGGKRKGVKEKLLALQTERARLGNLLGNIETFMDAFEKTQLQEKSGVFDAYLDRARAIEGQTSPAQDPISQYLDEVKRALE